MRVSQVSDSCESLQRWCGACVWLAIVLSLAIPLESTAQVPGTCQPSTGDGYLDIGNVRARILNNGPLFWRSDPNVYEVPRSEGTNAVFSAALWLAGTVDGEVRAAASRYGPWEFWSGPINDDGSAPADCAVYDRIWSVTRTDVEGLLYEKPPPNDLLEWPTGLGAPTLSPTNLDGTATNADGIDNDDDGSVDEPDEMRSITDEVLELPLSDRKNQVINLDAGERPDLFGDQMLWWIMNDVGNEHRAAKSSPMGVEVHGSAFAFDTGGHVGNTSFYRYRVFNRGSVPIRDAYIGFFADVDLGNFDDDYIGSDSTLGLGITYNSDNLDEGSNGYGEAPPAIGFDFLQGPIVESTGEAAELFGNYREGYNELGTTSVMFYNGGACVQCDPVIAADYYNYMQGRWKNGQRMTLGDGGFNVDLLPTRWVLSGDASEKHFWSEFNTDGFGRGNPPADRRFVTSSGPFELRNDLSQDVFIGIVWARGHDNLDSFVRVKEADRRIQSYFDADLRLPAPPDPPDVSASAMNGDLILSWTNSSASNNYLDGYRVFNPLGSPESPFFRLEGYEVWEFDLEAATWPDCLYDRACRVIQTYDVVNDVLAIIGDDDDDGFREQYAAGTDSGIQHTHLFSGLRNYSSYFYGVRAYAHSNQSFPSVLFSPIARVVGVPSRPGSVASDSSLIALTDSVQFDFVASNSGVGTGFVRAEIVDPLAIQSCEYRVVFIEGSAGLGDPEGGQSTPVAYDVYCNGRKVFDGSSASLELLGQNLHVLDGLEFSVLDAAFGIENFTVVSNASGRLDPPQMGTLAVNDAGEANGFPTLDGATRPTPGVQQSSSDAIWALNVGGGSNDGRFRTFQGRSLRGDNELWVGEYDYEIRFTAEGGKAYRRFEGDQFVDVPFELWRIHANARNPRPDLRLIPAICESACGAGTTDFLYDLGADHGVSDGSDDPFTDWLYFYLPLNDSSASAGYDEFFASPDGDTGEEVFARLVFVQLDGGTAPPYAVQLPEQGTTFRISTAKSFLPGDVATFSTAGFEPSEWSVEQKRDGLGEIGIVPNPYRAVSEYEISGGSDEVRFTNLPTQATIRVFTLNGTLIRILEKNSPGVEWMAWDLKNTKGLPLASGMYLIHVDVPDVGSTAIKFAMVGKKRY